MSNKIMDKEINKRMDSHEWDSLISGNVFKKRKLKKIKIISASAGSFAVAAVLMIILLSGIRNTSGPDSYDQLISSQVNGTYNVVFSNENLSDDIDTMIDEALSMR